MPLPPTEAVAGDTAPQAGGTALADGPAQLDGTAQLNGTAPGGPTGRGSEPVVAASGSQSVAIGRSVAQQRRAQRCEVGRGDAPECRPSGRAANRGRVAPKVEIVSTLRGVPVTGTAVGATATLTGSDVGVCQTVTGTEYAGREEYAERCEGVPEPGAAKVGVGFTRRGQRITGTEVGPSGRVTGDEHGTCSRVTGTEYLGGDQIEQFCGVGAVPPPRTGGSPGRTERGRLVTGTVLGRSPKVTGDEQGAHRRLTGSQYASIEEPTAEPVTTAARKVRVTTTVTGRRVTGTAVGASPRVTGDRYGACAAVTGTEYVSLEQYQACNRDPVAAPSKVAVASTWRDQRVTGTALGRSDRVTGGEPGSCTPVTGDPYVGPDQYEAYCDTSEGSAAGSRLSRDPRGPVTPSGARAEGGDRVTGSSRGARITVSGTPYASDAADAETARRGRLSGPAAGGVRRGAGPAQDPDLPSHGEAHASSIDRIRPGLRITGTAFGGGRQITGPLARAEGLVSGTPEFRYRDDIGQPGSLDGSQPADAARRHPLVTGEGRVHGFLVTGSAWRSSAAVTGTEGVFARRNPTRRGDPTVAVRTGAPERAERPEVPVSRVTGSSGCSEDGPVVTYSGGARG
jgi:hypothetical protein